MSKGESSSSTSQATTNQDNRIANDSGIVVAQGSQYINQLPPEAEAIFGKILDFSAGVVSKAGTIIETAVQGSQENTNKAIANQGAVAQNAQLGNASFFTTNAPFIIAGVVALAFILRKR